MGHFGSNGIGGHLFEATTLGRCKAACGGYLPRREAMDLVRKHQPAQKPAAALRLLAEVNRQLGQGVEFYTAVDSTMDKFHSVDGFFQVGQQVVTIDVTINDQKFTGKADVIVHADDFEDLTALARRIANFFKPRESRSAAHRSDIRTWRAA